MRVTGLRVAGNTLVCYLSCLSYVMRQWVAWWLEHRTPDRKAWVRCPRPPNTLRVHTEYVLVKSVGPKVLWADHANDRRTTSHDEFRGPRSDYVRQAKVLNGHLVGSNQLLLVVRKNVREAYGSKNDKDIVDIGVSYEMEAG
ncbi:hypothetical protein TNCV_3977001 [Trichonephila clavipes]|nr:hypothetical protein TNCV_3977001 [Trichonephila clavipes]